MRIVSADVSKTKGKLNRFFSECIGAGRAGEVMRHVAYEQLKEVQKECNFKYIRFHGLFHEEMIIVSRDEDGKLKFNFQYVDMLFDSLLDIGLRPVVELGLMPEIMAEKEKYVFWWKMNISSAKDISEWETLVYETVKHLTYRYGEDEVKKWYFEVWNEPNHPAFFSEHTDIDRYFELYDSAARAVKRVNPDYRVGGPASAGLGWIGETIDHCRKNSVPLDFISTHCYSVEGAFDADGKRVTHLKPVEYLTDAIKSRAGEICKKEGYPLLITEWSTSYSSRDLIHDSYVSAPFILRAIKQCEGYADMMSYWVYTDIFEEVGAPPSPFHGGFGLMSVQSLKKPVFHVYSFLNKLGENEHFCEDESAYVCSENGETQVLFWNYSHPKTEMSNQQYFSRPVPSESLEDAKISLDGFERCKEYKVTVESVGYKMGDVYSAYLERGSTSLETREESAELSEMAKTKSSVFTVLSDENGHLEFTLAQSENQVDFIKISL